jgi:hypothetical protein
MPIPFLVGTAIGDVIARNQTLIIAILIFIVIVIIIIVWGIKSPFTSGGGAMRFQTRDKRGTRRDGMGDVARLQVDDDYNRTYGVDKTYGGDRTYSGKKADAYEFMTSCGAEPARCSGRDAMAPARMPTEKLKSRMRIDDSIEEQYAHEMYF